jgi:hypothetical protein
LQELWLAIELILNPLAPFEKRRYYRVFRDKYEYDEPGHYNQAALSLGQSTPEIAHGFALLLVGWVGFNLVTSGAFTFGFSRSAFKENVSRLSRPRLDGALKVTF